MPLFFEEKYGKTQLTNNVRLHFTSLLHIKCWRGNDCKREKIMKGNRTKPSEAYKLCTLVIIVGEF
jgi:ribosomal protein S13